MPCRVDVLAYPDCFATEVFGIVDILTIANSVSSALRPGIAPPFDARVVSVTGARVAVSGGVLVQTEKARDADHLVVPGCAVGGHDEIGSRLARWTAEVDFLRGLDGQRVASVCLGAFLLAEAGLLDGRRATTSWLFASELARRHPSVDVQATALVVHDGRISTAGAFSAVNDLALLLVAEHAGPEVARATSNLTLVSRSRTSQGSFVDERMLPVAHSRFSDDVRQWLRRNLAEPYDLSALARAHHVSTRTLLRRFAAETGQSPLGYLRGIRVGAAKRLLETSDLTVREIMVQVGYTDAATFRRLFTDTVGLTPSDYRRQLPGT